jgi:hypothetical protein
MSTSFTPASSNIRYADPLKGLKKMTNLNDFDEFGITEVPLELKFGDKSPAEYEVIYTLTDAEVGRLLFYKIIQFDIFVETFVSFNITRNWSSLVTTPLIFNFRSNHKARAFINSSARFGNPNVLQITGFSNVYTLVNDFSGPGYIFQNGLKEYLPPIDKDFVVSVWAPDKALCTHLQYCLNTQKF